VDVEIGSIAATGGTCFAWTMLPILIPLVLACGVTVAGVAFLSAAELTRQTLKRRDSAHFNAVADPWKSSFESFAAVTI
jgi:hypothetical protein